MPRVACLKHLTFKERTGPDQVASLDVNDRGDDSARDQFVEERPFDAAGAEDGSA